jgi:CRP/FNR family transcriptional regulator, cyclic AMP receptor protein
MDANADALLSGARFAQQLTADHRARLARELVLREFPAGAHVCRRGGVATFWMGVATGTVKIQVISPEGRGTTLATFSEGCWFGEGTILKDEPWPFDAIALRDARIALVPAATFRWLLENSFPFNRFLIDQLNARLGQFISRCEHARLHQTDRHVAHCIAELLDPRLYPVSHQSFVRMSQEELGNLAGVSRAVVNKVLSELSRSGIIRVSYGSISLIDPEGLRRFSESTH